MNDRDTEELVRHFAEYLDCNVEHVRAAFPLLVEFAAEWMVEYWDHARVGHVQAEQWRIDMARVPQSSLEGGFS